CRLSSRPSPPSGNPKRGTRLLTPPTPSIKTPSRSALPFSLDPDWKGARMFIQTEPTPNPATLKFLPGREVLGSGTVDFRAKSEAAASPLAMRLFDINGVAGVFLGSDFIAVTKGEAEWQHLKPAILGAIMEHYLSGAPVVAGDAAED